MKIRRWSLLALVGLLFAYALPAFAADASSNDPTRVLRSVNARGTFLNLKVVDGKGRPMSGVRVTAVGSDLNDVHAVTGPDGIAHLDGLPNESKGVIHPFKKQTRGVNWDILLESGRENNCTIQFYTVYEKNPVKVKLPTPARIEHKWEPITYQGAKVPLKSLRIIDENWQEMTFYPPLGRGVITSAYTRPWEWSGKPMPMVTEWNLAVWNVIKRPQPKPAPAAPVTEPAPVVAPTEPASN